MNHVNFPGRNGEAKTSVVGLVYHYLRVDQPMVSYGWVALF